MDERLTKAREADRMRRMRGTILAMVYDNHKAQRPRLRDIEIWGGLERLQYHVEDIKELKSVLQDLKERGCITFEELRQKFSKKTEFGPISILPRGRDLVEETSTDEGVDFS